MLVVLNNYCFLVLHGIVGLVLRLAVVVVLVIVLLAPLVAMFCLVGVTLLLLVT